MPKTAPHHVETNGLDCANCGHERVVRRAERTAECPNCGASYALVVRDGFALMEADGWTARVAVDPLEDAPGTVSG